MPNKNRPAYWIHHNFSLLGAGLVILVSACNLQSPKGELSAMDGATEIVPDVVDFTFHVKPIL